MVAWIKVDGDVNEPNCRTTLVSDLSEATPLSEADAQQLAHFAATHYPSHLWWHTDAGKYFVVIGQNK
jgi:hypothetical protein